ncbi:iron chelate uptake ABC transporter family permease subunit [Bacillus lacus]|uniref:Manganese transport system membrane protein MntC n=1 Tax=Metabacillus lacus TaxID=1983721 RepID=A0A7X2IZ16_9BACI|nr:metal ABC transporter permease [Metabacillus lacus]MRX72423.1 iron chelate uptake ABC transporter family permease subunit [Metabacillus lacus]
MIEQLLYQLGNPNTQWVLFGTLLLGVSSGVLGSFALLRKQSLVGDAVAHAALPGVCLAFMASGRMSLPILLAGAALTGLIAAFLIGFITKHTKIKQDTSLGLVLSVFFGFGIVLLTYLQNHGSGNHSGLNHFIFGQAASMVPADVRVIAVASGILLFITALFFKEFKLMIFDPQFAKGIGLPTGFLNALLMGLIVTAVVIGLQAVGVILMAAMLITPSITARYWTDRLGVMIFLSGILGGLSGAAGTLLSTAVNGMPTGPLIIVTATMLFLISLVAAPEKGLLSKLLKQYRVRRETAREMVMLSLYEYYEKHEGPLLDHQMEAVMKNRSVSPRQYSSILKQFQKEKVLISAERSSIMLLSDRGAHILHEAVLKRRMYEVYLMHEHELASSYQNETTNIEEMMNSATMRKRLLNLLKLHNRLPLPLYASESQLKRGKRVEL